MAFNSLQLVTLEEYRQSDTFEKDRSNETFNKDNYVVEALQKASYTMDWLSFDVKSNKRFAISNNWDTWINDTDNVEVQQKVNDLKFACATYATMLLRNGLEWIMSAGQVSQGQLSYSLNPTDKKYIHNIVFMMLEKWNMLYGSENSIKVNTNNNSAYNVYKEYLIDPQSFGDDCPIGMQQANRIFIQRKAISTNDSMNVMPTELALNGMRTTGIQLGVNELWLTNKVKDLITQGNFYNDLLNWLIVHGIKQDIADKVLDNQQFISDLTNAVTTILLADDNFKTAVEQAVVPIIEDDEQFKTVLENALTTLLENNENFINDIINLVKPKLINDDDFINKLVNKVLPSVKKPVWKSIEAPAVIFSYAISYETLEAIVDLKGLLTENMTDIMFSIKPTTSIKGVEGVFDTLTVLNCPIIKNEDTSTSQYSVFPDNTNTPSIKTSLCAGYLMKIEWENNSITRADLNIEILNSTELELENTSADLTIWVKE